jgi:uncharacterized protein YdhG (YjbR/CyaY superfamily)
VVATSAESDRAKYFPAIEAKYGLPMKHWFAEMASIADLKYPEQISHLRENHGFSQVHANALVMYSRGSTSAKKFETIDDYLATLDATKTKTVRSIFRAITKRHPDFETVIAWNQPMLRLGKDYVFGLGVQTNHILLGPWAENSVERLSKELKGYKCNKKTIQVPVDWKVDAALLHAMIDLRLKELKS